MVTISGKQLIAGQWQQGKAGCFNALNPRNGELIAPEISYADQAQIAQTIQTAAQAFELYSETSLACRANFLTVCADEILALGDSLLERAMLETGYTKERIITERTRTCDQLRLFAQVLNDGDYLAARINTALPERLPTPRPDLRFINQPLGPVVVFGASNFPLAYSVAGGDTVAALAAGCSVIVKGHNSHPGTCELVAQALVTAVKKCHLPVGTFSMLMGEGNDIGKQLVTAKDIKAVGFTGSTRGGLALFKLANQRDEPIPVFAEMGSINPVILLPATLAENFDSIAQNFITSFTAGCGQFCVNPGLLIAIESKALQQFENKLVELLAEIPAGTLLNQGIFNAYQHTIEQRQKNVKLKKLAQGAVTNSSKGLNTSAFIFKTDAKSFINSPELQEEVFGHAALLVSCENMQQLTLVVSSLKGQLTGAIQANLAELEQHQHLIKLLKQKVGRLVVNNFPTGVEVCESMMHGGPFPASTDTRFTSVGTASISRFIRPICYQNHPESLLPAALKNTNILNITRLVNGKKTKADITSGLLVFEKVLK